MATVTMLDRKIEVFAPLKNAGHYIAMIEGFDAVFRGDSAMAAQAAADEWRRRIWGNVVPQAVEIEP